MTSNKKVGQTSQNETENSWKMHIIILGRKHSHITQKSMSGSR